MFDWGPDKLSFSFYSKVNAFLQIGIFRFFAQRKPYTSHNVGKIFHCKAENDMGKYYYWYSQKNLYKFQLLAVFNFHEWQYWISLGLSRS